MTGNNLSDGHEDEALHIVISKSGKIDIHVNPENNALDFLDTERTSPDAIASRLAVSLEYVRNNRLRVVR